MLQLGSDKLLFVCYLGFRVRTGDAKAKPKKAGIQLSGVYYAVYP